MIASSHDEVVAATTAAERAAPLLAASTLGDRAHWLRALADALDNNADELVPLADSESHLGVPRLTGEVARTSGQLRMFADVILEGSQLEVIIDHAAPDATPPRPDIRRMLRPLGPVAVFAASNFPFAFSVLGGDTASALAAGDPVVVKAHPGHEELSARTAALAVSALAAAGAPDGTFGIVYGMDAGTQLVTDPRIQAASFTGSQRGGRALHDLAAARPAPIPFYGELGSLNPVVITPAALAARGEELAAGLVGSFTLGVGQYCTKPGVVFVPAGAEFERAVVAALPAAAGSSVPAAHVPSAHMPAAQMPSAQMLDPRIASAFATSQEVITAHPSVAVLASGTSPEGFAAPLVGSTTVSELLADPETLLEERFGPFTLLVSYGSVGEVVAAVAAIGGSLTGTLHSEHSDDADDVLALGDALARTCGRVLFAGWPTGVAVTWSQQHGGPWPSTTASIHTSVGATAIRRFLRPIAFQSAPEALLPDALRESNPLGIPRRVDGRLTLS